MKKTQRNPLVITNVLPLGKGEVACSNHAGSTILSLFISMLRSYFIWLCACIYAGFALFIHF